jgi:hypothetical protein
MFAKVNEADMQMGLRGVCCQGPKWGRFRSMRTWKLGASSSSSVAHLCAQLISKYWTEEVDVTNQEVPAFLPKILLM